MTAAESEHKLHSTSLQLQQRDGFTLIKPHHSRSNQTNADPPAWLPWLSGVNECSSGCCCTRAAVVLQQLQNRWPCCCNNQTRKSPALIRLLLSWSDYTHTKAQKKRWNNVRNASFLLLAGFPWKPQPRGCAVTGHTGLMLWKRRRRRFTAAPVKQKPQKHNKQQQHWIAHTENAFWCQETYTACWSSRTETEKQKTRWEVLPQWALFQRHLQIKTFCRNQGFWKCLLVFML